MIRGILTRIQPLWILFQSRKTRLLSGRRVKIKMTSQKLCHTFKLKRWRIVGREKKNQVAMSQSLSQKSKNKKTILTRRWVPSTSRGTRVVSELVTLIIRKCKLEDFNR